MKKAILILTAALVIGQTPISALAHGCHAKGHYQRRPVAYTLCSTEDCHTTGIHLHDGVYYYGHYYGDGHDYHEACDVAGCEETTEHEHDGRICLPCNDDNCYNTRYLNRRHHCRH